MNVSTDVNQFWPRPYSETRQKPLLRVIWCVVNKFVFPVVTNRVRVWLLKLFGAKISNVLLVASSVRFYAPWNFETVGRWTVIGPRVEIYNKDRVVVGDRTTVSQDCYICTASHSVESPVMELVTKPVVVEDHVWVAAKAVILPGVTVHTAAVVGCAAVVTKDVAPWTVVAGNPAVVVKARKLSV